MELKNYLLVKQRLLETQLKTIRDLQQQFYPTTKTKKTQVEMVFDILNDASEALHINEIIARVGKKYNIDLDRETIVSSIAKKIAKGVLFKRVDPNTYDLLEK